MMWKVLFLGMLYGLMGCADEVSEPSSAEASFSAPTLLSAADSVGDDDGVLEGGDTSDAAMEESFLDALDSQGEQTDGEELESALSDSALSDSALSDGSGEGDVSAEDTWTEEDGEDGDALFGEDADGFVEAPESVRLNHLQGLGTHNSYHKKPDFSELIYPWDYEHLPLDEQMGVQGIRQFELDVYFNEEEADFDVYHIAVLDDKVTCGSLTECIGVMKGWSDENLSHHPFVVLIELKTDYSDSNAGLILDTLDEVLLSVWPKERLVTPDVVQGDFDNVRDAIAEVGWPSIQSLRGRGLFVLHAGGDFASAYTEGGTTTEGRVLFPDAYGNLDHTYAAVHSMNDPKGGFDSIQSVVGAGHLVRTRSDSDSEEAKDGDYSKYEAALESGAHFISTDYPGEPYGSEYAVNIPGGTPSRCNPISAPPECTSEGIEFGLVTP